MTETSSQPQPQKPLLARLLRYPRQHPGQMVLWLLIALMLYAQWPMLKGTYYRARNAPPDDHIAWRPSFEAAVDESRQTGKPILVDFMASWCPPCQVMKYDAWPDERVGKLIADRYIPVAADVDDPRYTPVAQRYGIDTLPAVLILNADGQILRRGAFMMADDLTQFLQKPVGSAGLPPYVLP